MCPKISPLRCVVFSHHQRKPRKPKCPAVLESFFIACGADRMAVSSPPTGNWTEFCGSGFPESWEEHMKKAWPKRCGRLGTCGYVWILFVADGMEKLTQMKTFQVPQLSRSQPLTTISITQRLKVWHPKSPGIHQWHLFSPATSDSVSREVLIISNTLQGANISIHIPPMGKETHLPNCLLDGIC